MFKNYFNKLIIKFYMNIEGSVGIRDPLISMTSSVFKKQYLVSHFHLKNYHI